MGFRGWALGKRMFGITRSEDITAENSRRSAADLPAKFVRSSTWSAEFLYCERMTERIANAIDRIHEFGYAFQGKKLALDGDQD